MLAPVTQATSGLLDTRPDRGGGLRQGSILVLAVALIAMFVYQDRIVALFDGREAFQTWSTVFVSIVIQASPFLVLGVLLSSVISAFVPASFFARALPRRPAAAVPVAGAAGLILPGCECASVPVAGSLIARGVAPAAALTFLLAAPAINPVVLVSTFVAFPGRPEMVGARFVASLLTAVVVGWLWLRFGKGGWLRLPRRSHLPADAGKWAVFRESALHDMSHAGGFLVVGGLTAATLNVTVPQTWLDGLAGSLLVSVLVLAVLAVVLAICSEADAFVAASLTGFSPLAQLVFMVVGPVVDVKLIALQSGTFGPSFAARFAPATFAVAVLATLVVGGLVL
jgi:uncharacterized membrane protein YraQ (UPF0718 family)